MMLTIPALNEKKINAICFDLDDTLVDSMPVLMLANDKMMDWLKRYCPEFYADLTVQKLREEMHNLAERYPEKSHHITWLRQMALERCMIETGFSHQQGRYVSQKAMQVFLSWRSRFHLFPEAQACLTHLKAQGFLLGLWTNGNGDVQRAGYGHLFDHIVRAEQLSAAKPHHAFFTDALQHAGFTAEATLYIGDHPKQDMEGALNAGLHRLWYNPNEQEWTKDTKKPPQFTCWKAVLHDLESATTS